MRGIDLRAPIKGVTLVIARSFSCQRNADQALMRVGRYGDPCHRFIAEGLALVDEKKQAELTRRLYKFAKTRQPKASAKKGPFLTAEVIEKATEELKKRDIKAGLKQGTLSFPK